MAKRILGGSLGVFGNGTFFFFFFFCRLGKFEFTNGIFFFFFFFCHSSFVSSTGG